MEQHRLFAPYSNPNKDRYYGLYFGVIEQRIDPLRMGRLRVRVGGLHSDDIQVEDLPWALPNAPWAWPKGGSFGVPPLGEIVSVMFVCGDPEYPVWMGGHWGAAPPKDQEAGTGGGEDKKTQVADGKEGAKHFFLPSSMFGGKENGGVLRKENIEEAKEQDAPNNYGFASPFNKHIELDDRRGRQKVKFSDQNDNMLFFNCEHSSSTWQIGKGLQSGNNPFGVTFNADEDVMSWQISANSNAGNWTITSDIRKGFIELATPGLYKILLDKRRKRLELWTGGGHHIIAADGMTLGEIAQLASDEQALREKVIGRETAEEPTLNAGVRDTSMPLRSTTNSAVSSCIVAKTSGGRTLMLGDSLGVASVKTTFLSSPEGSYVCLHEEGGGVGPHVEVYSAGTFKLISQGDFHVKTIDGIIALDGKEIHLNSDIASPEKIKDRLSGMMSPNPWLDIPGETKITVRAFDYPYFNDPEKIKGYDYRE